jgi:ATP-dependent RNA helicase DDX27
MAALLALCKSQVKSKVLVFCNTRAAAHRAMLVLALLGKKAADLHGDLSHAKRMAALRSFRDGEVNYLVSTDLAARGLDIEGVEAVVNLQMPRSLSRYVHRVGRTARAGKSGRAISLVTDSAADTALLREIVRHAAPKPGSVVRRRIPDAVLAKCRTQVAGTAKDMQDVLDAEKQDKEVEKAGQEADKARNLVVHEEQILSRPRKAWIMGKGQKRKLSNEARKAHDKGAAAEIAEAAG